MVSLRLFIYQFTELLLIIGMWMQLFDVDMLLIGLYVL